MGNKKSVDKDRIELIEDRVELIVQHLWEDEECRIYPVLHSVDRVEGGCYRARFKERFLWFYYIPFMRNCRSKKFKDRCCYETFMESKGWKQLK